MADDKHQLSLMSVPLEVRHQIFKFVAVRNVQPKKLLRHWFERKEVKEKVTGIEAKNSNADYHFIYQDYDDTEEEGDSGEEGEGDGGSDQSEEEGGEEDDEDEENSEDEDDAEHQDADMDWSNAVANLLLTVPNANPTVAQVLTAVAVPNPQPATQLTSAVVAPNAAAGGIGQSLANASHGLAAAMAAATTGTQTAMATATAMQIPSAAIPPAVTTSAQIQSQAEVEDDEESDEEDEIEEDNDDADDGSDEEMAEGDSDVDTEDGAAQPAPPLPLIIADRKWRHIPKFLRITHCPPPVELLLASKQLNAEARNWFYDVAVLQIDATGSFAHTSFFEEAFSQITEAAFSPIESVRRVEVTFVWDTTWLRSEQADFAAAIFPALLRQRALFVSKILAQAPCLSEVTVQWHDSAQDEETLDLMNDVLKGFLGLGANIKVVTHYIAADAKPYRKSIAGKQRVGFQQIVENGIDLF